MSETEDDDLRSLSEELAAASNNPSEPACIIRAFLPKESLEMVFTLERWLLLESLRSPLLTGRPFETPMEFEQAVKVFGLSKEKMTPEVAAEITCAMREVVAAAFAMVLPMQPEKATLSQAQDGFGAWLPLFAFLVTECGINPADARAMDVGQAFALLAAVRRNQGWTPKGDTYAIRDVIGKEEADA